MRQLVLARAADRRLTAARAIVALNEGEVVVIAASRGAADDFVREIANAKRATFGLHRFSLAQLASRIARLDAARDKVIPAASLMIDAIAGHASHDCVSRGTLSYLGPVANLAGFPPAVRRTVTELRLSGVPRTALRQASAVGRDVASLLDAYEEALETFGISDLADLYERATRVLDDTAPSFLRGTVVLLDVPLRSVSEARFVRALADSTAHLVATLPADDAESIMSLRELNPDLIHCDEDRATALGRVREQLFVLDGVAAGAPDETVTLFSAPGEGREALEVARAIMREAERGVRFDEIAVLLRNPSQYIAHIETAFRRAGIPTYFAHGARRPDPAGRAFLALLTCGLENLSARRFAEYLSLGQVPLQPDTETTSVLPSDETLAALLGVTDEDPKREDKESPLREPWKWEELVVEAAVLGGADRWERRLSGLQCEYAARLRRVIAEDPQSSQAAALARDIERLMQLRSFALPVLGSLCALKDANTWGDWLDQLEPLARSTLRSPQRVLRALADLRPMAAIGPIRFADVIRVLKDRLSTLARPQAAHRFGAVFVAPIDGVRGRSFRSVFVPGVAERNFPVRPREDPLLLDRIRNVLPNSLVQQAERLQRERLLLQLVAGAASERLYLSYARMDVREGRARVSSFYALDVLRAVTGAIPDYEAVERDAAAVTRATMAWPAPPQAEAAIDALEYDLANLRPLLMNSDPAAVRGRANYLVRLHPMLGRSLRVRRARWRPTWGPGDGLVQVPATAQSLLDELSLQQQPYSPSALEHFAACPYRFYLAAIVRLNVRKQPEVIESLDPLTRGTLVHDIYAAILRALHSESLLLALADHLDQARTIADRVLTEVAAQAYDALAPAIDLIWETEIAAMRTDMQIWLGRLAITSRSWIPAHFELGFGLDPSDGLDPASKRGPAVVTSGGYQLRGAIDLVERSPDGARLRIRDYKTGEDHAKRSLVVGGGEVLQPTLYALAAEQVLVHPAAEGQLWYATSRGGFRERTVALTEGARRDASFVLAAVDAAIRSGDFPAAPRKDACEHCDFRRVCGPYEEMRIGVKTQDPLGALVRLRGMA